MKLFDSSSSPFVRKVNVVIHAHGLGDRIERLAQAAHPIDRDANLVHHNPLGQVPTLVLDDGSVLSDSRVICEYLDALGGGGLFPAADAARWRALTWQSLADGLLDAAILIRYESNIRPERQRWSAWIEGQWAKIHSVLAALDIAAPNLEARLEIGTLSLACALGYLDFRFADVPWRARYPAAAEWYARMAIHPSVRATEPKPRA